MNTLKSIKLDNRVLCAVNLVSAAVWHLIFLFAAVRRSENTAVLLEGLFYLLPLLSLVVSCVLLGEFAYRSPHRRAWLWLAVIAGVSPFVTFVLYLLNSQ